MNLFELENALDASNKRTYDASSKNRRKPSHESRLG